MNAPVHFVRLVASFLMAILLLNACTEKDSEEKAPELEYAYALDTRMVHPQIQGYWKSLGNGYLLDASSDSILLYSYTDSYCYKEKNDYVEGLLNSQSQFRWKGDTLQLYLTDFDHQTDKLQARMDFVRLDQLPENCISFSELQQASPIQLLDLYLETLNENYAFAEERNLDWDTIRQQYQSKISDRTTQEDLFQVMGEIATLTKDQHTKIIAQDGRRLQYTVTPSAEIVMDAFNRQSEVEDLDEYFTLFFNTNYTNISDSLLHGQGQKVANGQIEWGSLNEQIGYIHIFSFTGFTSNSVPRKQQIDTLNQHMETIINALKEKEAIVVDISFNFGGYDAAGLTIASHFTDTTILAYTSQLYYQGEFYSSSNMYVEPTETTIFTKPVYVLMTDISRSAAESFAMMMKALPQVKLVGTPTLGTLSGMLGKSIGPFYSTSSNQRLLSPTGKNYEVIGVEPDIALEVFGAEDVFESHYKAVKKLAAMVGEP